MSAVAALTRWDAARTRELATALAELDSARTSLTTARRDGSSALAASAGRVAGPQARSDLAALLVGLPSAGPPDQGTRRARTEDAARRADAVRARSRALTAATAEVRTEHARWLLATATAERMTVHASLGAAVAEAGAALAASEGRVLDEAPRAALRDAVAEAGAATRPDGGADLVVGASGPLPAGRPGPRVGGRARAELAAAEGRAAALREESAVLRSHVERLATAGAAVAAAQSAWQAEQDRRAAERAAAGSAPERTGSGPGPASGRGVGGARGSGPADGTAPATPATVTPPGSTGGTPVLPPGWSAVVETEGGAWCGDELGASWEC